MQDLHWRGNNTLPAPNLWNVAAVKVVLGADCRFSVFGHWLFPNITSDLWSQMNHTFYSFVLLSSGLSLHCHPVLFQ